MSEDGQEGAGAGGGEGGGAGGGEGGGEGGSGGGEKQWYSDFGLNDASVEMITKNGYKSMDQVFEGYSHAEKVIGAEDKTGLIPKPSGNPIDNPDEWKDFHKIAGVPDDINGYSNLENLPEGITLDDTGLEEFKQLAHKSNLSDAQFLAVLEGGLQLIGGDANKVAGLAQSELDRMGADLKKDWGSDYDGNLESAKGLLRETADKEFVAYLNQSGLGDDPRALKYFHDLAQKFGDGDRVPGGGNRGRELTKSAAQAELARHEKDYDGALNDRNHARHTWAVQRRVELEKLAGD